MKLDWHANLGAWNAFVQEVVKGVNAAQIEYQRAVKLRLNSGPATNLTGGGTPGGTLGNNTGTLSRSFQLGSPGSVKTLKHQTNRVWGSVGTNVKYAPIHEYGGVISGKGKYLAVPIGVAGRRAARDAGGNIRSLNLTLVPRRGRPSLLVRPGRRGSIQPLFVLVKSVRIPARPFMRPSFAASKQAMIDRIRAGVDRGLAKLGGKQ